MKNCVLMTGSTRGIGQKLKEEFEKSGTHVVSLTRANGFDLSAAISEAQKQNLRDLLRPWFFEENHAFLGFLHCAGVMDQSAKNIQEVFQVNVFSFVEIYNVLNEFFHLSAERSFVPRILSLSSGAALTPYSGWEGYCSSKAALLSYSKCLAQKYSPTAQLHLSIAPGTVYTDMMKEVLAQKPKNFPQVEKFLELEKSGRLEDPSTVAQKLFRIFFNTELCEKINGVYSDLRKEPLLPIPEINTNSRN
jgi:benzil reductase ((S)-benzoin forming)